MARVMYSQRTKEETLEYCRIHGIGPGIRELKKDDKPAPSWTTIAGWFKEIGEDLPSIDSLAIKANAMKQFYSDNEKKYVAQKTLERIASKLDEDDLDADDLKKLADALNKSVVTMNLIEGKATSHAVSETKNGDDLAIQDLLSGARARNMLKADELS